MAYKVATCAYFLLDSVISERIRLSITSLEWLTNAVRFYLRDDIANTFNNLITFIPILRTC